MDISHITQLFGHSVYDPQVEKMLKQCDANCEDKASLKRYDSIISRSLGIEFWFWWKFFYQNQIGEPQGTIQPEDSDEVVLKEIRLTDTGLSNAKLPFGLSFPATPESVLEALGRKPFSKSKNFAKEPIWIYYEDRFELLVIFEASGEQVRCFKIFAMSQRERLKIDFLNSLPEQKQNLLPDQIPKIEASIKQSPSLAWQARLSKGDTNFSAEAIQASEVIFKEFLEAVCKATKRKNAKSIYTAITKATKAVNKVAKAHPGCIETTEREEIIDFFNSAIQLTGLQFDPQFDLTEEYRSW